ncbi:hypothetical protein [Streptomyces sp. NPDC051572]|nr:hypothetical protein OG496_03595 [Streptomyces sp. NBC_00988]
MGSIAPIGGMTVRLQGASGVFFRGGSRIPAAKWATRWCTDSMSALS